MDIDSTPAPVGESGDQSRGLGRSFGRDTGLTDTDINLARLDLVGDLIDAAQRQIDSLSSARIAKVAYLNNSGQSRRTLSVQSVDRGPDIDSRSSA